MYWVEYLKVDFSDSDLLNHTEDFETSWVKHWFRGSLVEAREMREIIEKVYVQTRICKTVHDFEVVE